MREVRLENLEGRTDGVLFSLVADSSPVPSARRSTTLSSALTSSVLIVDFRRVGMLAATFYFPLSYHDTAAIVVANPSLHDVSY
jgi:hypothetical protein